MRSYARVLPCLLLLACSAPESANRSVRCSPTLSCPDELVCYRGFCVDDGLDPSTGGPVSVEPGIEVVDAGASLDESNPGRADAGEVGDTTDGGATSSVPSSAPVASDAGSTSTDALGTPSGSTSSGNGTAAPGTTSASGDGVDAGVNVTPPVPAQQDGGAAPVTAVDAASPSPPPAPTPAPTPTPVPTPNPTPTPTTPLADAGVAGGPCAVPCTSATYDEKQCNQCVKDTYGESPGKLCKSGDDGNEPLISLMLDPVCVSLCLGAARKSPTCIGLFSKRGPALGGEQP